MRNLKKLLAVILTVVMITSMMIPALAANTYEAEALKLQAINVFAGGPEDLKLDEGVTRIQGLTFAIRIAGKDAEALAMDDAEVAEILADWTDADSIPAWGKKYAAYAIKNGITVGLSATQKIFGAMNPITGTSFMVFIMKSGMGYADVTTANVLDAAVNAGIVTASQAVTFAEKALIRDDAAAIMYGAFATGVNADGTKLIDAYIASGATTKEAAIAAGFVKVEAPKEFKVESVKALNLRQIEVKFNKEVDEDSAIDSDNYSVDTDGNVDLTNANFSLQDDNKTVIITLPLADKADQQEKIDLTIQDVEDADGNKIKKVTFEDVEFLDVTLPEVLGAEVVGNDTIKVKFSEPMSATKASFEVDDGSLYIKSVTPVAQDTEYNVELYTSLKTGTVKIKVKNTAVDAAGYGVVPVTFEIPVVEDKDPPVVVGYKNAKPTEVTLIFNEDIEIDDDDPANFYHTNSSNTVDAVDGVADYELDGNELTLKFTGHKLPNGTAYLYIEKDTINDLWDNLNTKIVVVLDITVDNVPPAVKKLEVKSETQIIITFTEDIDDAKKSNFTVLDEDDEEVLIKRVTHNGQDKVTIDFYDELNGFYSITIKDIEDLEGNKMAKTTETFEVDDLSAPEFTDFVATLYNAGEKDQMIRINFKEKMAVTGKYSVLDLEKYTVANQVLADLDCEVTINAVDGDKAVEIYIPSTVDDRDDGINLNINDKLIIARVADAAGNYTKLPSSGELTLNPPATVNIKKAEATAEDTIVITFDDEFESFDIDDIIIYVDKNGIGYDDNDTVISPAKIKMSVNSNGESVATITLAKDDKLDADATFGGFKVRIATIDNPKSKNKYGEKLKDSYDGATVYDKIKPAVVLDSDDVAQVYSFDVDEDNKNEIVVIEFNEVIDKSSVNKYSFSVKNINIVSIIVSNAETAIEAAEETTSADGRFIVIKLDEADTDLKADNNFTVQVKQEGVIFDKAGNKLYPGDTDSMDSLIP